MSLTVLDHQSPTGPDTAPQIPSVLTTAYLPPVLLTKAPPHSIPALASSPPVSEITEAARELPPFTPNRIALCFVSAPVKKLLSPHGSHSLYLGALPCRLHLFALHSVFSVMLWPLRGVMWRNASWRCHVPAPTVLSRFPCSWRISKRWAYVKSSPISHLTFTSPINNVFFHSQHFKLFLSIQKFLTYRGPLTFIIFLLSSFKILNVLILKFSLGC